MTLLDFERSGISTTAGQRRTLEQLSGYLQNGGSDKREDYRLGLADLVISNNVAKYLGYRIGHIQSMGQVPNYEASVVKIFQSELGQKIYNYGDQDARSERPADSRGADSPVGRRHA